MSGRSERATVVVVRQEPVRSIRVPTVTGELEPLARVISKSSIERHLQAAGEASLAVREQPTSHVDDCRRVAKRLAAWPEARE